MSKYLVTGKMVVHFPFELEIEADDPITAEQEAVQTQRAVLSDVHNLETNERPVDVHTSYIGE